MLRSPSDMAQQSSNLSPRAPLQSSLSPRAPERSPRMSPRATLKTPEDHSPDATKRPSFGALTRMLSAQHGIVPPKMARTVSRLTPPQRRWNLVRDAAKNLSLYHGKCKVQELAFFQKLQPAVQLQLLKAVHYVKLVPGIPLYFQGDTAGVDDPGNLYILISGEVSAQVLDEDPEVSLRNFSTSLDMDAGGARNLGKVVASIQPGALLGHISLMDQKPRANTCVCAMDCEFLMMRKRDFDRVLRSSLEALADESAQFLLKHVPGLKTLPRLKADHVMHSFQRKVFEHSYVFPRHGEQEIQEGIFVIFRGAVEVRKGKQKVSTLVPGATFGVGTPSCSHEDFTFVVNSRQPCETFQVGGSALQSLPQHLRADINKHLTHLRDWHCRRKEELESSSWKGTPSSDTFTDVPGRLQGGNQAAMSLPLMGPSSAPRKPRTRPAWVVDTAFFNSPNSRSVSRLGTSLTAACGRRKASPEAAHDFENRMQSWSLPGSRDGHHGLPQANLVPHKTSRARIAEARQVLKKLRDISD